MSLTIPTIKLDAGKPRPQVEFIFGDANVGNYRCFRWDAEGKKPKLLSHGNNIDDVLDVFTLDKDASDLKDTIFSYEAIVQAPQPKEGQLYSLTIMVRQQGELCEGGFVQHTGTFTDAKSLIGFRRFAA